MVERYFEIEFKGNTELSLIELFSIFNKILYDNGFTLQKFKEIKSNFITQG